MPELMKKCNDFVIDDDMYSDSNSHFNALIMLIHEDALITLESKQLVTIGNQHKALFVIIDT